MENSFSVLYQTGDKSEFCIPFIGQLVWQVRRTHGSFLTLEFGVPHLAVREPIVPRPSTSGKIKRHLQRRHITVTGDWHFWVQYGDWKISTAGGVLTSDHPWGSEFDECLRDLDGQRLVCVGQGAMAGSCAFNFDLGAILQIWPSSEVPEDQWSLYSWNGDIVTCGHDGALAFEKADVDRQVFKPLRVS
jgi:hypothetical protein